MDFQIVEGVGIIGTFGQGLGQDGTFLGDVAMDNHSVNDLLVHSHSADHNDDHQLDDRSLDHFLLDHDTMSEAASSQDFVMEDEEDSREPLNYELQIGFRILKEIMSDSNKSVNWPFMEPVDTEKLDLWDYKERIQKPMWLKKIEQNFHNREYQTITDFVSDVRLMLENCYRYNGPDHYISKRGQKLEMILEQKLALLSRELREKTSIAATSGKPIEEKVISGTRRRKVLVPHDSTALLNQLRLEEKEREKEQRRQQMVEKQKEREAYLAELQEWEDSLYPTPWKKYLNAMWEVPQIGHFLFLCSLQLNIGEVVHWELERGFLLPRESSTFQTVMTSLISTPYQRTRLDKKPLMPYKVWEDRVRIRIRQWYKVLNDFKGDQHRAAYKLGIDSTFFKSVGLLSPMEKKKFHELTFYQRIWIVKSLCDWCLENQESIREAIEANVLEDQKTYSLGYDAEGFQYIHFPQFCGADLRIYKQAPVKMPKSETRQAESSNKKQKRGPKKPPRKRDARVRHNTRPSRTAAANYDSSDGSSDASEDSGISGSESEEDPEPKVPRYNRAAVTRNKLLDVDLSDVSREGTPTRVTRSRTSNVSGTPSRESTPQRTRRSRRGESSNTPEASLYQRRSLRCLGIEASEMASIYNPVETPESSETRSPSRTIDDDDDDRESTASDVKRSASASSQTRKRRGRPRSGGRRPTRKTTKESDNEEQDESMDISEVKDEGQEVMDDRKPFTSYVNNGSKPSEEGNNSKSDQPSGKVSPSNCDTKSVHSECPSEPATFVDSECSYSVRSTPVNEVLNTTDSDKDKCAVAESKSSHSQEAEDDKMETSASNFVTETYSKVIDSDLRDDDCDEAKSCDDKSNDNIMDSKEEGFRKTVDSSSISEENMDSEVAKINAEPPYADDGAMGDGPLVKSEEGNGDATIKTEGIENAQIAKDSAEGSSSVEVKQEKNETLEEKKNDGNTTEATAEIEPEITEPVIGEFELIVESVDDLRTLVLKFAPPEPVTEVKGTREKVIKPIPRKKCEVELHKRLLFLLEELEPWEQKLIAANKRARLKMRREHANYRDDPEPEEDIWESEESDSEDENSEDDEVGIQKEAEKEKERKKQPTAEVVVEEMKKPPTPDLEVSSRGRIRKRRVIPDAADDEGSDTGSPVNQGRNAKRRRNASPVPTTSHSTPVTTGVPSNSTIQSVINQLAATNQLPSNGISVLNINNQMVLVSPGQKPVIIQTSQPLNNLSMSNLNLLAQLTGLVKPATVTASTTNQATTVTQSPSRPQPSANILRQASPKPAGSQSLISAIKPGQITAQQVLMLKKQQQLQKQQAKTETKVTAATATTSQIVTVMPSGTPKSVVTATLNNTASTAAVSATKPQYVAYNNLHQMAPQVVQQLIQAQMKGGALKNTASGTQNANNGGKVVQILTPGGANASGNVSGSASTPQSSKLPSQVIAKLISPTGKVNVSTTNVVPSAQTPVTLSPRSNNNTLKQSNPGLLRALSSPPKPKYAGNVTVKSLLESRAAQQKSDTSTSPSSLSSSLQNPDFDTLLDSDEDTELSSGILLDPERERRLDEAIKTVLTEIHTTLPTATMKVASPFVMSGVKTNRSITVVTSAMKAPIPALPQITCQSSSTTVLKTTDATGTVVSAAAGGVMTADAAMKVIQGQGGVQKLVLPVQLKPPGQALASLTPRNMAKAQVTSTDVGNLQAVVSNTALLQQHLNNTSAGNVGAATPPKTLETPSTSMHSATAKLQQAASEVVTTPQKTVLKIHSISVQGSSATLQLTGVHGVAPGKAVQLKLTIPPGLTIHQLLQSPQLQQHLANLQSAGLSAAAKSVAVQRPVSQNTTPSPQSATQAGVQQQTATSPGNRVLLQQTGAQVKTQLSAVGTGSQVTAQVKTQLSAVGTGNQVTARVQAHSLQTPATQRQPTQLVSSQGKPRAVVMQRSPVQSAQSAVMQAGLQSTVTPSTVIQLKPQNATKLSGERVTTSPAVFQQRLQTPVAKASPQTSQNLLRQQQNLQGTIQAPAQQVIAQSTASMQPTTVLNVGQSIQQKVVKQAIQKPVSTIKHIAQNPVPKPVSQSPQKPQIGSTKSQTVQQLLEAAQRRAANQNQGATAQMPPKVSAVPSQGIKIAQSSPMQVMTQVAPKAVATPPQANITSPSKLVLVNMNGQLMTSSGLPVTMSQGMLRVVPGTSSVPAASPGVVQLPAQQVVALASQQQPQQQVLMLPQQALASPVKVATQATGAGLTAQHLLAVQQAQVQANQLQVSQAQAQVQQVQHVQQVQVQPTQVQHKLQVQSPASGIKIGGGVTGTLVQSTQAQASITLPSSAISQSPGVAHIRMPVGTVIVPPNQTNRPTAAPTNLTAVRLADGRYVLQVPSGSGASKLVLPSSSTTAHLPNGDSS